MDVKKKKNYFLVNIMAAENFAVDSFAVESLKVNSLEDDSLPSTTDQKSRSDSTLNWFM